MRQPARGLNRFDVDTGLTRVDERTFEGRIDRGWWIERGPNGGYVAAIVMRALVMTVDDPERSPRSFTVHFTQPPSEGSVHVVTAVERRGRSLTTLTARMSQGGQLVALATAAFSLPRPGIEFSDVSMPDVPPPRDCPTLTGVAGAPEILNRYEMRPTMGAAFLSGVPPARAGGWLRLAEPRVVDPVLATAYTDAWFPPVFSRVTAPVVVPTVDLTIHYRAALPLPAAADDDYCLGVFQTDVAAEGFLAEDAELWSEQGVLLVQSRQLALARPLPADAFDDRSRWRHEGGHPTRTPP